MLNNSCEIMGVLNITPDSFYDGKYLSKYSLQKKFQNLESSDIIDIGAESTRPGAKPLPEKEELRRVEEFISLNLTHKKLSIDSYKSKVIEYCLINGFNMINDISGGGKNFENIDLSKEYDVPIVIMHMQGNPLGMQQNPNYKNLIDDKVEENKIIKSFINKKPSHSFNIYVNKKNLNDFKVSTRKDGISESLFNIAEALYSQRMYDLSIAYCYLSLYLNKNNFINYYLLSQNFIMLQKAEKAISVLQNIPLNSYLGWNSFLKIADINLNLNHYSKAENFILQLKKYSSNRVDVHYKLGEIYHNKKDYVKAIKAFNEAISLLKISSEENWYLYYSRGMSYERSNQWAKAEKDFLYALELSPRQPLVLNYLGYTWIDYGINIKKAENFIREAIKLRPKDGYFIDSLGWAYYRQGKYDLAVLELEKAVGLIPNDPVINDHLGDALFRAGYYNEAKYQWNRALLYEPEKELKENIKFKLEKGL